MRGFTLIELLITLALVGLLASVALPLYEVTATRAKEAELRQALRTIRTGLDAYKAATDTGQVAKSAGESGFPATLDLLTQPLEITTKRNFDSSAPQHMVILRALPRDPFFANRQIPAAETWKTRAYASRTDDPQPGADVFDVSSTSEGTALDGTHYKDW